jgi:hypothetical protein
MRAEFLPLSHLAGKLNVYWITSITAALSVIIFMTTFCLCSNGWSDDNNGGKYYLKPTLKKRCRTGSVCLSKAQTMLLIVTKLLGVKVKKKK